MKVFRSVFRCFLFVLCNLVYLNCLAQTPTWQWANAYGPNIGMSRVIKGLGIDANGNIYHAGSTLSDVNVGNIFIPGLKSFLLKYNSQGQEQWAYIPKGILYPENLHTQPNGDTYLTGYIRDTVIVGSDTLLCKGRMDMFVAKFDNAGNGLWAKRAGGIGRNPAVPPPFFDEDGGTAVTADSLGNVYVAGYFWARPNITVEFDSIKFVYPATHPYNGQMGFVAKYNPQGKIQWVSTIADLFAEAAPRGIGVNRLGECYLAGNFGYDIQFTGGPFMARQGQSDIWYAKYGNAGNLLWAKSIGNPNNEYVHDLVIGKQGNCFLTGSFRSGINIGPFILYGQTNGATIFAAKFDGSGNALWASKAQSTGSAGDSKITVDKFENVYVGASYTGSMNFANRTFTSTGGNPNPVVLKWNNLGQEDKAAYGRGFGTSYGIGVDHAGTNCYLSGYIDRNLSFDFFNISTNAAGFFLAKLGDIVNGLAPESDNSVKIYPNPARDILSLDLPGINGSVWVKLTDLQGRDVHAEKLSATPQIRVKPPTLASGVYLVTVQTKDQILRNKLVIE